MTTDTLLIEQAKHADLLALATQHTQLRRNARHDWAGACPRCGGTDRFHVYQGKDGAWRWRCYQCSEKPADAIAFLRWLRPALSFPEAVAELSGALPAFTQRTPTPPIPRPAAPRPAAPLQPEAWRERAEAIVEAAHERLMREEEGEPGRAYLESRGINSESWLDYDLGYRPDVAVPGTDGKERAPAIVLPWYAGGRIVALRYRFIAPTGKRKITAEAGSSFAGRLFGGQKLAPAEKRADRFLLLVEGELNGVSVAQACGRYGRPMDFGVDVLSLGSESARLTPAAIEALQQYRKVIVWADRAEVARELAEALPGSCATKSPGGQDANDLLKAGRLSGAVVAVLMKALDDDINALELLLENLYLSASKLYGIDSSAAVAFGLLARRLGRSRVKLVEARPGRWLTAEKAAEGGENRGGMNADMRRLQALLAKGLLLADEAAEVEALAARLGVRLRRLRFDLNDPGAGWQDMGEAPPTGGLNRLL
jgi:hypothetical protein